MKRFLMVLAVTGLVAGCSVEKGSIIGPHYGPIIGDALRGDTGNASLLSLVQGTWTGSQTASVGLSGGLSVTFSQAPVADANVAGSVAVTLPTGTFHGTFTGTIDNIVLTATDGPAGACGYVAHGVLNQAGTQITGAYSGTGAGPNCVQKAGTFVLNGTSYVPPAPVDCGTTSFYVVNVGGPNDNGDGARKNKCENTTVPAGVYVDNVTIGGVNYHNVCRFSPVPPGAPGNDLTFISSAPNVCPTSR